MAQPTPSDVHIDRPLTNISIAFLQAQDRFIGTRVFPVVPVEKQGTRTVVNLVPVTKTVEVPVVHYQPQEQTGTRTIMVCQPITTTVTQA